MHQGLEKKRSLKTHGCEVEKRLNMRFKGIEPLIYDLEDHGFIQLS